ncbi:peptidase M42 [Marivirga tractuosa]|uniref:Peptidase M42 family protein n=1 Tax=Marivirga tractuosa (strain ATCC 23168 / DSM 4126 / NBRC 15989 / NCIMB 1408 / VKM B-1430 / H-43) TaxID=643867 RepID=E4TLE1_MARTH|nr:M42 family metallopeptidase [Marivirga tractuosa]ADR21262.1 peptidase M42 family protein [Marivirga tractuosa DSM 4126]BDD14284.1 peptidase M42 [Marivirga tractuosa]
MDKIAEDFLFKYLNNAAPTGFETSGQKLWLEYIKPYTDEFIQDNYGTVAAIINKDAPYKVVIEAHADEISWFVNYISDDGYIYVVRNGGSDHQIAPSKRVNIHTDKGIVKGIFGWPAIHVRNKENDIKPELKNIFIDVGANNKEEVEKMGIHVGCVITFDDELMYLKDKDYIVGRALDNRIGGFMIAEVARKIHENKDQIPFALYIVNAVQEEVGLKGAQMIAHQIKPDVAVITDVCHDTHSPLYNKVESGDQKSGKGPVLTYGPAVQNNLLKMLIELAEKGKIPFQRSAASRATGTDTDAFAYSNEGVPSALVSLPLKYMHTTVEMVHSSDVQSVIDLLYSFVVNLKDKHNFRYKLS